MLRSTEGVSLSASLATHERDMRVSATMSIRREKLCDVDDLGPYERGDEVENTRHLEEDQVALLELAVINGLSA